MMVMRPARCPPDVVLGSPHEADAQYHQDWTKVPGDFWDDDRYSKEKARRERRDQLHREHLEEGKPVFYKSTGDSMWPLIQSNDHCTLHPIKAVTAGRGGVGLEKEKTEIGVGDVVFCRVQPKNLYFTHFVHKVLSLPDPN